MSTVTLRRTSRLLFSARPNSFVEIHRNRHGRRSPRCSSSTEKCPLHPTYRKYQMHFPPLELRLNLRTTSSSDTPGELHLSAPFGEARYPLLGCTRKRMSFRRKRRRITSLGGLSRKPPKLHCEETM
ncbi:hypothetical protein B0H12DRAFT_1121129 [Mycena haematopus]|nr:hypothetical protein B0H12DRAFT_1121129 [Mycena haematopus]